MKYSGTGKFQQLWHVHHRHHRHTGTIAITDTTGITDVRFVVVPLCSLLHCAATSHPAQNCVQPYVATFARFRVSFYAPCSCFICMHQFLYCCKSRAFLCTCVPMCVCCCGPRRVWPHAPIQMLDLQTIDGTSTFHTITTGTTATTVITGMVFCLRPFVV